ncbi:MAG: ABC transporter ATP-binding protein [Pseudomonadota bacterium]|nr:ABC transporter ATP-binding protein [Pseudomonadota bacterium]
MSALLEIYELRKHFPGVLAVDGVSFALEQGTCFGLLGPNGAGKTTTIEMLEGIKQPDTGRILYRGEPQGDRFRDEAGIMFQRTALQDFITAREALEMFQALYPRSRDLEELIEACALGSFLDRDTRKLSGGQRQRLLLAIALVNDPEIVFLDEPTTGLDPQARRAFWALIRRIRGEGKTILLTTHYMEEAWELCDEIAIMDHGRIIAQGIPRDLLARHFDDVVLELPRTDFDHASEGLSLDVVGRGDRVEILSGDVGETLGMLMARGMSLQNLRIRHRTLEDLFLELTGSEIRP